MQNSVPLVRTGCLHCYLHSSNANDVWIATASYRILPLIILNPLKPVPPEFATKFQNCFAPGVIQVDPRTKAVSVNEKNMRKDNVSREVLRHPEFEGCVELKRVRDFFLCQFYHYPFFDIP